MPCLGGRGRGSTSVEKEEVGCALPGSGCVSTWLLREYGRVLDGGGEKGKETSDPLCIEVVVVSN